MKTRIFSIIALAAFALGLASCNDDRLNIEGGNEAKQGSLSLAGLLVSVDDAETAVASRADVDVSSFIVEILQGDATVNKWTYSQMPELVTLSEGEYTVKVQSHQIKDAEWNAPYYAGSKSFTITKGQITDIGTITCTFQSVRVSVNFSDDLLAEMDDDCTVKVEVGESETFLTFTKANYATSSAYFRPVEGSMTLVATFSGTVSGNATTTSPYIFTDVAGGKHYRLSYSALGPDPVVPEENGTIDPSGIVVNTSILGTEDVSGDVNAEDPTIDPGKRPGTEDPKPDPDPQDPPTPPAGDPITFVSETLSFDSENGTDVTPAAVTISAANGIANLYVTIESDNSGFLSSAGDLLPLNFDLAYPGSFAEDFESLGFPTGNGVIGKTSVNFDISEFVPLLAAFTGHHKFTIRVVDQASPANEKSVTLRFLAQ